jgi:hypothetical protein
MDASDGILERATDLISAARNTDDHNAKALFAARARNALAEAEAKIASLRINVGSVEARLAEIEKQTP